MGSVASTFDLDTVDGMTTHAIPKYGLSRRRTGATAEGQGKPLVLEVEIRYALANIGRFN